MEEEEHHHNNTIADTEIATYKWDHETSLDRDTEIATYKWAPEVGQKTTEITKVMTLTKAK